MGKINVLNDLLISKIAAGEVVERPSSVVKELVENSIDAGATSVLVEIRDGGIGFIRITDNGIGIEKSEVKTAFLRHATSKILSEEDLYSIKTLGFRGEALASIACVSKLTIVTKYKDEPIGTRLEILGGDIKLFEDTGAPEGTVITMENLFYNTPARLKFLKSEMREGMYITELMQNLAMSHPEISFKYKKNDSMVFSTMGDNDLKNVIFSIYGKEVYNNIIEANKNIGIITIYGFIGNSNIARSTRSHQSIFLNGRFIKNKTITAAVENAYKSMLTINKFPFFLLHLNISTEFIDVNVHPSKLEVKFQDEQMIFRAVYKAVQEALISSTFIPDFSSKKLNTFEKNVQEFKYEQEVIPNNYRYENVSISEDRNKKEEVKGEITKEGIEEELTEGIIGELREKTQEKEEKIKINNEQEGYYKIEPLSIIGQIHFTYIIAEGRDDLYLIDQHAAHERIYYEKYMGEYKENKINRQMLLTPIVVDLSPREKEIVISNPEFFNNLGFELIDFGLNSISIRTVPMIEKNRNFKEFFFDILNSIDSKLEDVLSSINKIIYTMACKSAVKAGDKLTQREMEELVKALRKCDNPFTCPHGRPTIIKTSYIELEKKFKRIQ